MITSKPLSRRHLLRGAGGLGLGLPLLDAMSPRRARAASDRRRFIVFFTPNGSNGQDLREDVAPGILPTGQGSGYALGIEAAPLNAVKSDLLIMQGLDNVVAFDQGGEQHTVGFARMLTRADAVLPPPDKRESLYVHLAGGPSIDQVIAQQIGGSTRLRSLELGVQTEMGTTQAGLKRMISTGPAQFLPSIDDPRETWKTLFGGSAQSPSETAGTLDHARALRRSVLDFLLEDYKSLAPRLGTRDRATMDRHLTTLRELELRLQGQAAPAAMTVGCAPVAQPNVDNAADPAQYPVVGKLQMDLLVMALACDLTRVASLQWSTGRSDVAMPWIGINDSHHGLSHMRGTLSFSKINTWYAEQVAYFAKALKAIDEEGTSILGNTVVWWCSEVGYGRTHGFRDVRAYLLGQAGGYFQSGQLLPMRGTPLNKLMVSFMHAMGMRDRNSFGSPAAASGPLPGFG